MKKQIIVLPEYSKWSPKFKTSFMQRVGKWNHIYSDDDMQFAKEIRLVIHKDVYTIEIDWYTDIVEVLKNDLPISIKKQIKN
jgi:hypothetical protein